MKKQLRDLEVRDNWIAARIDELLADAEFVESHEYCGPASLAESATKQAEREHAAIIADLEESIIDSMELN